MVECKDYGEKNVLIEEINKLQELLQLLEI